MAQNDDPRDSTLPVTGEVGSEGGSFADPTVQVSTFDGDVDRVEGRGGASSSSTQATRSRDIGAASGDAPDGVVRYPTEPPDPPSASEGRRMGVDWKMGLAGAAAGAAIALAVSGRRRRSGERRPAAVGCDTLVVAVTPPLDDEPGDEPPS
jgi:hypothetical protein